MSAACGVQPMNDNGGRGQQGSSRPPLIELSQNALVRYSRFIDLYRKFKEAWRRSA